MKKILVTGPFEGAVELVYGETGLGMGAEYYAPLVSVGFGQAVLPDDKILWFMQRIPARMGDGFEQCFGPRLKVIVADMEVDFYADFYNIYGKKINPDRVLKEWTKMTVAERALASYRVTAYLRYLSRTGIGKADPENYLKKKYFKNDYDNL